MGKDPLDHGEHGAFGVCHVERLMDVGRHFLATGFLSLPDFGVVGPLALPLQPIGHGPQDERVHDHQQCSGCPEPQPAVSHHGSDPRLS
jgi:hypothetical protein